MQTIEAVLDLNPSSVKFKQDGTVSWSTKDSKKSGSAFIDSFLQDHPEYAQKYAEWLTSSVKTQTKSNLLRFVLIGLGVLGAGVGAYTIYRAVRNRQLAGLADEYEDNSDWEKFVCSQEGESSGFCKLARDNRHLKSALLWSARNRHLAGLEDSDTREEAWTNFVCKTGEEPACKLALRDNHIASALDWAARSTPRQIMKQVIRMEHQS